MCIGVAVLKSPKNVRNKKIWANQYCTTFRKKVAFPQPLKQKVSFFRAETILTRKDELFELRRLDLSVVRRYSSFGTRRAYWDFWWRRKARQEWSPIFYKSWRYHYNTYNFVKQDWPIYRIGSIYQNLFGRINSLLPAFARNILKWFTNTFLFESLVWVTARFLQLIDYTTTTFRDNFTRFWQYPTDESTPKKYVRWFFGTSLRYKHVKAITRKSLTTDKFSKNKKKPSTLVLKLSQFKNK